MIEVKTKFALRLAVVDDIGFIFELRVRTMKPFFECTLGWNETEERKKAADELSHTNIVMVGEKRVGVIKVIPKADELHLHQMQILPELQMKGIGSELIRQTIVRSKQLCKPVTLYVLKNTPAKRLYEQWGFFVIQDYDHHCKMCRHSCCI